MNSLTISVTRVAVPASQRMPRSESLRQILARAIEFIVILLAVLSASIAVILTSDAWTSWVTVKAPIAPLS
jgi:hypothetical protein